MRKVYYRNVDFLRTFSSIGILCMHVLYNGAFVTGGGYFVEVVIKSMGILVRLFFAISGFSLCCGYYERAKNGTLDYNQFYLKRYRRILPFFAALSCIYAVEAFATKSMMPGEIISELVANITLLFGLFPGAVEISIVGLGWTLGPIFAFYILFPFFVVCCWTKKRAWFALGLALAIHLVCIYHFTPADGTIRANLMPQVCYFISGMLVYLYRESIAAILNRWRVLPYLLIASGLVLMVGLPAPEVHILGTFQSLLGCGLSLAGVIGREKKIFSNGVTAFLSGISMEIYLCHAFLFGVINRFGLAHLTGNEIVNYIYCCVVTLFAACCCAKLWGLMEWGLRKAAHQ